MTTLSDLRLRVEKASGADRELDAAIIVALYPDVTQYGAGGAAGTYWRQMVGGWSLHTAEPLTASLDAVVALIERVMPERLWGILHDAMLVDRVAYCECRKQDLVLALLAAFLAALEAKESSNARD